MTGKHRPAECRRCEGDGLIGSDEDGAPWSFWTNLPPGSDIAVRMGWVVPIPCPDCSPAAAPPVMDRITWTGGL